MGNIKEYEERLKKLGYNNKIINIVIGTIKIAEQTITNTGQHWITPEVQKLVVKEIKEGNNKDDN